MHEPRIAVSFFCLPEIISQENELLRLLSLFHYVFTLALIWRCLSRPAVHGSGVLVGINLGILLISYGLLWNLTRPTTPWTSGAQTLSDATGGGEAQVREDGGAR